MSILFDICGRAGSKGIKNKNLRDFCGLPLVYYTVSAIDLYLKRNPRIDADIVVNSDSIQLIELVENNGMRKVERIVRDPALANDTISKIAVIKDCLEKMAVKLEKNYEMVVDMDITSPLRTTDDLAKVIELYTKTGADVVTTVADARRNPYFNQVKRTDHGFKRVIESDFTARQQAPEIYDMNASIYAIKPEFLETGKGVLEGYCEVVKMYDTGILDLDHENDFELMEVVARYLFEKNESFREIRDNIKTV